MKITGIDVSTWQGDIDWNKVKRNGIGYAIIRSSFGSPDPSQVDNRFEQNYKGAKAAGLPVGAYHYGYAVSEAEARQEAKFFLDTIKGKQFEYPVYYDVEDSGTMGKLSKQALTNVVKAFCSEVEKAGYYVGVYASLNWLDNKFYPNQLPYDIWVAQYYSKCQYTGNYGMWQYSSSGSVPGIAGSVDMNECYQDYPKLIKERGLNGFPKPSSTPSPAPGNGPPSGDDSPDSLAKDVTGVGQCIVGTAKVHTNAARGFPVAFSVTKGNSLNILESTGTGWLKIWCLHGIGYIQACNVKWSYNRKEKLGVGKCTADVLNVRAGIDAKPENEILFQISTGNLVDIIREKNGWYLVNCLHGVGWCAKEYIQKV